MGNTTAPSDESCPNQVSMQGNRSWGGPASLQAGGVRLSTFSGNDFPVVRISRLLRSYWTEQGNTWNGSPAPPPE